MWGGMVWYRMVGLECEIAKCVANCCCITRLIVSLSLLSLSLSLCFTLTSKSKVVFRTRRTTLDPQLSQIGSCVLHTWLWICLIDSVVYFLTLTQQEARPTRNMLSNCNISRYAQCLRCLSTCCQADLGLGNKQLIMVAWLSLSTCCSRTTTSSC